MAADAWRRRGLASAVCLMLVALAACATGAPEAPPVPAARDDCVGREGSLDAGATLREAAGSYRLTLFTAGEDGAQRATTGTLYLQENPPDLRRLSAEGAAADDAVNAPLYGWAALDLQPVAALHVTRVEETGGFSGTWTSGVHARRVEGHFCAVPVPAGSRP